MHSELSVENNLSNRLISCPKEHELNTDNVIQQLNKDAGQAVDESAVPAEDEGRPGVAVNA